MNTKLVKCLKCGWVHFEVSKDFVDKWKEDWDKFWPTLSLEWKKNYGLPDGPPSTKQYYHCFQCSGSYKNMRDLTKEDDKKDGHTIQPILGRQYL